MTQLMPHTALWTWDARMLWRQPGWQQVLTSTKAFLENYKDCIDYCSEHRIGGVIIWGFLRAGHGGVAAGRELAAYGLERNVRVIPAVGVRSYGGFCYEQGLEAIAGETSRWSLDQLLLRHPEWRRVGREGEVFWWSHPNADLYPDAHCDACPSRQGVLDWYLEGIEWLYDNFPIGGVWLENGDNGLICQCRTCVARRGSDFEGRNDVCYQDETLWMSKLAAKALEKDPDSWVMYQHLVMYDRRMVENPSPALRELLESVPRDVITVYKDQRPDVDPGWVIEDCEAFEAFRDLLPPPGPPTRGCVVNWSIGPQIPMWGVDGWPQHRIIAKAVHKARQMGHTGMIIYGELADRLRGFTGRAPRNEINYLALAEFCRQPELTVEVFEDRYRDRLKKRIGWPS